MDRMRAMNVRETGISACIVQESQAGRLCRNNSPVQSCVVLAVEAVQELSQVLCPEQSFGLLQEEFEERDVATDGREMQDSEPVLILSREEIRSSAQDLLRGRRVIMFCAVVEKSPAALVPKVQNVAIVADDFCQLLTLSVPADLRQLDEQLLLPLVHGS